MKIIMILIITHMTVHAIGHIAKCGAVTWTGPRSRRQTLGGSLGASA